MTERNPLARVAERPQPRDWGNDEIVTLKEIIAVFYPNGPLAISSLRSEIRRGGLPNVKVRSKYLLTPAQLRGLFEPSKHQCHVDQRAQGSTYVKAAQTRSQTRSELSETDRKRSAQAALRIALAKPNRPSPNISPLNGPPIRLEQTGEPATRLTS